MDLTAPTTCKRFKYRLMELFILHFGADAFKMRKEFATQNNISLWTVKTEFNYLLDSGKRIPEERLNKYAQFLNIETTALRNYTTLSA